MIVRNQRAFHEYEILDRIECGIVLVGTEVKSLRDGFATLDDAYAKIDDGEVWLIGSEIPEYAMGNRLNHKPKRPRKLLLHRREIEKFAGKASQHGFTLVPLRLYFKDGRAKVETRGRPRQADARQARVGQEGRRQARDSAGDRQPPTELRYQLEVPAMEDRPCTSSLSSNRPTTSAAATGWRAFPRRTRRGGHSLELRACRRRGAAGSASAPIWGMPTPSSCSGGCCPAGSGGCCGAASAG